MLTFTFMYRVYILFSASLSKYYIGYTGESIDNRLKKHLAHHRGFTGKAGDWKVVHTETYDSKQQATSREKEIKNWKSRKMIEQLINPTE